MNKLYPLLLLVFITACRSAQKSYSKGDYADAIELGIRQLQKDPADITTSQIVKDAYTLAVNRYEGNIRTLSAGSREDQYAKIYEQYNRLQDLYETIQSSPAAAAYVKPQNYAEYLTTYRNKAAEVHINRADELMLINNKRAYRDAYGEYKSALRYLPKDRQLLRKRDSAYDAALTKIVVVPLQTNMPYGYGSSFQLQRFQDNIMRTLAYNMNQDFVKFYSEWEARSNRIEPDQVMELALGRIYLGQPYDQSSRRQVSKQVVVKETVYKPDSVVKEYANVRAWITTTQRTLVSEGELFIVLRDLNNRIVWDDRFTGQHQWQTRFATFTGDQRALSESDLNEINNQQQQRIMPREEEVLEELFRQIEQDLQWRLRNYFSR
jgi:hypothetical protein